MLPEGTSRMPGPRTRQADICHMTQVGLWAVFGIVRTNICLLSKVIQESSRRGDDFRRDGDVFFTLGGREFTRC
jgi:hypothetical protein